MASELPVIVQADELTPEVLDFATNEAIRLGICALELAGVFYLIRSEQVDNGQEAA